MAYPKNMQLNEVMVTATAPSLTTGTNVAVRVPFRSQLVRTGVVLGSAAATANATIAVAYVNAGSTLSNSVLGSSVVTVVQSNSFAGQVFTSDPTSQIILDEDAGVTFAVTGSSTSGSPTYFAIFKEA